MGSTSTFESSQTQSGAKRAQLRASKVESETQFVHVRWVRGGRRNSGDDHGQVRGVGEDSADAQRETRAVEVGKEDERTTTTGRKRRGDFERHHGQSGREHRKNSKR